MRFIDTHAAALSEAMEQVEMSDKMRQHLEKSNYLFSGFKAFHERNEAFPSILDKNGNKKPFERFLNDVQRVHKTYNQHYLRAEYNFVSASAEMAERWEMFEKDGDNYLLQYRTIGDSRVRPEHSLMNGITLPFSSPFWEQHFPPNGWNCRCTVVQVRKGKYKETDLHEAQQRAAKAQTKDKKGMFRFNAGKERKSIPDYNPYTIKDCKGCKMANGYLAWSPLRQLCRACVELKKCYEENEREQAKKRYKPTIEEKRNVYKKPIEEQFDKVYQAEGGIVLRHQLKDKLSNDYERVLTAAALYAEEKKRVLIMPEIHVSEKDVRSRLGLPSNANPDLNVGGRWIDVKSPFSTGKIVSNANQASSQGGIACITDDHCIIPKEALPNLAGQVFRDPHYKQKEVHFIVDGILYKYNSQGQILG